MGSYGELVSYSSGCVLLVLTALLSAKLVPVAYGIKKLQIACVVEDDKVNMLSFTLRSIRMVMILINLVFNYICVCLYVDVSIIMSPIHKV